MLKFWGYSKDSNHHIKTAYIVAGVSFILVSLFLIIYIFFIRDIALIIMTSVCLLNYALVFPLLKFRCYIIAKSLILAGLIIQVTLLMFIWFAPEAELQYFLFLVAPISFFIFDLDKKIEKILVLFFNLISIAITLIAVVSPNTAPILKINQNVVFMLQLTSVASVYLSILVVFYIYSITLKKVLHNLEELASIDSLTNIPNRRTLFDKGESIYSAKFSANIRFTFLLFDIDHFKDINDAFGHPVGDSVLVQLTELVSKHIREEDILARYGGEEFAIILHDIKPHTGIKIANSIRTRIERHPFIINNNKTAKLTISIGAVTYGTNYSSFDEMVIAADKALYEAKETGRNRVVNY